ncbi:outer membrane channel protein [Lacunisphaera limnophila]|uniref:Outer membrane channel protein n=1 Tax=Lacunisphaera limnophila TaxID=1838286 RepID=A0A1D8AVU0_9BACT|nr:TolC family protein [Lacunisphaera limnophila]AOS45007.1 outer membrane channel protein [Lacunisphaera limnophila]
MHAQDVVTPEMVLPQLDAILKRAVAQSPRMISRAVDLEIAENDLIASRAGLLPSVGGNYSFNKARDKRGDLAGRLDVDKVYYNFSLNQPLFHWGERRNSARIGQIRETIAQGQYRDGYRLYAQELRSLYFSMILGKLRAKRAAFQLEYNNRLLQQGEERLAKKVISEALIFGIRIEAERAAISAERAIFDYENIKASFSRLTGEPAPSDESIPDSIPALPPQTTGIQNVLASYLAQAEIPSVEAVNFRHSLAIEKLNLANQKTRLRPKFNLVLGISQDEQSYSLNVAQKYQVNSQYVGISANWTVFDGFSARSGVRSALAKIRQLEGDYKVLSDRIAQQAQTQARLAGFHARYASINDRLLDSSQNNLISVKEQFARGVIAQEDVSVVQLGLFDHQINAYSTRADYYSQVSEFLGTVAQDPVLANLPLNK